MSIEKLALVVACALILVSAFGIAYLAADQFGAIRQINVPVDEVITPRSDPVATVHPSQTQPVPPQTPVGVAPGEPSSHSGLAKANKATVHALVGGAFGAGSASPASNRVEAEKATLRHRAQ
jgi:hypothetical protein